MVSKNTSEKLLTETGPTINYHSINTREEDSVMIIAHDGSVEAISEEELMNMDGNNRTLLSQKIKSAMMLIISAPKGAAQFYATFGPIAMIYQKNGLWLTAPVATGAAISITHAMLNALKTHCLPDNKFVKLAASTGFCFDEGLGGFLADFGFAWSMMRNLGSTAGQLMGASQETIKTYALYASPALAFFPALVDRGVRYKDKQGKLVERGFLRHFARTLRGASSTLGFINQLILQGVIANDSYIPTAIIGLTAIAGGASSLLQESHGTVSTLLMAAINLLCENPSLATAFFSFPNDIYASITGGSISEEFFYTNLAVSCCFLLGLESLSLLTMFTKAQEIRQADDPGLSDDDSLESNNPGLSDDDSLESSDPEHSDDDVGECKIEVIMDPNEQFYDCYDGEPDDSRKSWCNIL